MIRRRRADPAKFGWRSTSRRWTPPPKRPCRWERCSLSVGKRAVHSPQGSHESAPGSPRSAASVAPDLQTRPDSCCRPDDDAAGPEVIGESATRGFSSPAERLNISVREVGGRVHGRQWLGRDADRVRFATHLRRLAAQALADQRVAEHPERVGLISEHLAGDLVLPADRHALLPVFPFCHASGPRLARHRAETAECPARGRAMSLEDSETRARPSISHG